MEVAHVDQTAPEFVASGTQLGVAYELRYRLVPGLLHLELVGERTLDLDLGRVRDELSGDRRAGVGPAPLPRHTDGSFLVMLATVRSQCDRPGRAAVLGRRVGSYTLVRARRTGITSARRYKSEVHDRTTHRHAAWHDRVPCGR
jgi:hypothetical protein